MNEEIIAKRPRINLFPTSHCYIAFQHFVLHTTSLLEVQSSTHMFKLRTVVQLSWFVGVVDIYRFIPDFF